MFRTRFKHQYQSLTTAKFFLLVLPCTGRACTRADATSHGRLHPVLAQHKFPRFCSLCAKSKCPFFSLLNISYFTHSLLYSVFCRFSYFQILLILFYCQGLKEKSSDTTSLSSNSSSRLASILQSTTYRQQSVGESNHIQEMMEMLGSEEMCTYFLEHPCQSRGYPETSTAAHPPTRL